MAKFLMLGKYSTEAIKGIGPERTKKAVKTIKKLGGKVEALYTLLGTYDLASIVDFPRNADAIKASIALTRITGIGFTTFPAITVEEFDKIIK
ncbi:MAG: GYD domain-containing protein [Candidatus Omnitrophica bacterium]|nr:GYD domain-containing protein [Candidatus Omnitrophota bacterium]